MSDTLSPPLLSQCAGLYHPGTALDNVMHCELIRHRASPSALCLKEVKK